MLNKIFKYDAVLFRRFWVYLQPNFRWVLFALISLPFGIISTILVPWMIVHIVDVYLVQSQPAGLYTMILLTLLIIVVGYLADAVYSYSLQKSGQLAIFSMRQDLYRHILRLPRSFYDKNPIGVLLTRLTSDMEALGDSLGTGALSILTDTVKTIGLFGMLFYLSWELASVIVVILVPIMVISRLLRVKLRKAYDNTRDALAESTGFLQECLNGVKTIQLYAVEYAMLKRYDRKNLKFLNAQKSSNFYDSFLYSFIDGITSITISFIIWHGANQILDQQLSIGVLVGFIHTLGKVFVPIREFTQQLSVIQRALSALESIHALFQEPIEEEQEADDASEVDPQLAEILKEFRSLRFDEVFFRYHEEGPDVLNGVSFTLEQGQRIAIVGTTGSGKSTIVRLLTKVYETYRGSIKINDVELREIPKSLLTPLFSMMQQDVVLFSESITFNIALKEVQTPEELQVIKDAAEYVYAHTFIENLPEAYDFQLLDHGKNLSSGQAQLVAFARAIARQSDVLILDEATSSVDSLTEDLIQKAIEKVFQQKTVIAIAHRLSTIQSSDLILVMQHGNIVESGTHQQLLEQQGTYLGLLQELNASS